MLAPDTVLQNRYRVVRLLGKGGMGAVYEAVDARLGATVALKETLLVDEALRRQFEREARLLARLHHPALPRVSDHFTEDGGQFLVMQFVHGDDVEAMRKARGGTLPPEDVLAWCDQLLDALDYLHTQEPPVIHRDIKPHNLKLSGRGQIILLDFGLAKGLVDFITSVADTPGSVYGYTRGYAPLEQIEGTGTDPRSDLYSLAATVYHLLTGQVPVDALARARDILNGGPDPLRPAHELSAQVNARVSSVLQSAMALRSGERPRSAAAMRAALREVRSLVQPGDAREVSADASTLIDAARVETPTLPTPKSPLTLDETSEDLKAQSVRMVYPADGGKAAAEPKEVANPKALTDAQKHHFEYWAAFKSFMEWRGSTLVPTKPLPQYWMDIFPFGRSGFKLVASDGLRDKWVGVDLTLSGPDAGAHFQGLLRERDKIEAEAGELLEWREKLGQKQRYVTLRWQDADPADRSDWGRQHVWLLDKLELFRRIFAPRVAGLAVVRAGVPPQVASPGGDNAAPETPQPAPQEGAPEGAKEPKSLAAARVLLPTSRRGSVWSKARFVISLAVCLAVVVPFAAYFIRPAYFLVRRVNVEGASRASTTDIVASVRRQTDGQEIWEVNTALVGFQLGGLAWVRQAEVIRDWPDGLIVRISERKPLLITRTSQGRLVWVDEDGVALGAASPDGQDFFIRGLDESSSNSALRENRERMAVGLELKADWERAGLSKRVSEVDLADLRDVRVHLAGADSGIQVSLITQSDGSGAPQNYPERFRDALKALDQEGRMNGSKCVSYIIVSPGHSPVFGYHPCGTS